MNKKEIELINDIWQLWEDIHMAGQLITNKDFGPKYRELRAQVKILNKHFVINNEERVAVCDRVSNFENNRCINCGAKAGHKCELQTVL